MHIVLRLARKSGGAARNAKVYIWPLAVRITPRLPGKRRGAPRNARAYIRSLGSAYWPTPKGCQGIDLTPRQYTLSYTSHAKVVEFQGMPRRISNPLPVLIVIIHACHAKDAEPQGTPGRTSDPLAVHIVPYLLRIRRGAARDARAYIKPLGNAHYPTPGTQGVPSEYEWVIVWVIVWVSEKEWVWVSVIEWVSEWAKVSESE